MPPRPITMRIALALAVLLISAVPAVAETVKLTFAWPKQVTGKADFTVTKNKVVQDTPATLVIKGSYDFVAKPIAEGQIISFANPEVRVESDLPAEGLQAKLRDFLVRAASTPPSYVIDKNGHYVRLEGLPAYRENLRAGVEAMIGDVPEEAKAQVRQVIDAATSERQLGTGIVDGWNRDVGAWAGAEMTRGEVYEQQFMTPLPMLGNAQIPMRAAYSFVKRVPCREGDSATGCVMLELKNFVDSAKLNQALEAFMQTIAKDTKTKFTVDSLTIDSVVHLITEPETLLPHSVTVIKTSTVVISHQGGTQTSREIEEKEFVYTY